MLLILDPLVDTLKFKITDYMFMWNYVYLTLMTILHPFDLYKYSPLFILYVN